MCAFLLSFPDWNFDGCCIIGKSEKYLDCRIKSINDKLMLFLKTEEKVILFVPSFLKGGLGRILFGFQPA
ncbi:MAG: hypothetical protein ABFD50_09810, partial [Smithella sp.]